MAMEAAAAEQRDAASGEAACREPSGTTASGASLPSPQAENENEHATATAQATRRRVTFVGAEYIEYDLEAAPVVRRCGVRGDTPTQRTAADWALEWQARRGASNEPSVGQRDVVMAGDEDEEKKPEAAGDDEALRLRLESEYAAEMREAVTQRGFPLLDESDVPLRVQFRVSELLVAWSLVAAEGSGVVSDTRVSLDAKRRQLELCRKDVFGPVVDGYAFGRRFFSIDSFLSILELEELVALAESHAISVPSLPADVITSITVADRELISTYSPTGLGKPLKMLTFRELVEEAYARGILMDDVRDAKQKKSKRAWVDALRPVLHAEMRAFKIREAHAELIHEHLAIELEGKMRGSRIQTVVELVKLYLEGIASDASSFGEDEKAMHRYFTALIQWHEAQQSTSHPTPSITTEAKSQEEVLPPAAAPA